MHYCYDIKYRDVLTHDNRNQLFILSPIPTGGGGEVICGSFAAVLYLCCSNKDACVDIDVHHLQMHQPFNFLAAITTPPSLISGAIMIYVAENFLFFSLFVFPDIAGPG